MEPVKPAEASALGARARSPRARAPMSAEQLLALHPWPEPWRGEKKIEKPGPRAPGTPEALWPCSLRHLAHEPRARHRRDDVRRARGSATAPPGPAACAHEGRGANLGREPVAVVAARLRQGLLQGRVGDPPARAHPRGDPRVPVLRRRPARVLSAAAIRLGFPSIARAHKRVRPPSPRSSIACAPRCSSCRRGRSPRAPSSGCARSSGARRARPPRGVDALIDRSAPATIRTRTGSRSASARVWKLPEQDLLRVALHATRAGLSTPSWGHRVPALPRRAGRELPRWRSWRRRRTARSAR